MDETLAKAIFAAGHRAGYEAGSSDASAFERGHRHTKQTPAECWDEFVTWRIDTTTSMHLDINNPEHWADVP